MRMNDKPNPSIRIQTIVLRFILDYQHKECYVDNIKTVFYKKLLKHKDMDFCQISSSGRHLISHLLIYFSKWNANYYYSITLRFMCICKERL